MKRALLAIAGMLFLPSLAHAQNAGFIVMVGNDTIAVESFTRTAARVTGELSTRGMGPRLTYLLDLANGAARSIRLAAYGSARDTAAIQTAELVFRGDSAIGEVKASGKTVPQRFQTTPGAFPFVNLSFSLLEPALAHARATHINTIPLFALAGGQTFPATIKWVGTDSVIATVGGVDLRLRVDQQSNILGGGVAAQNMHLVRTTTPSAHIAAPDYSAPANAVYTAENVKVDGPAGVLAGTLTRPKNRAGRVPVVVTISGSGLEDRDEAIPTVFGYRPFRQIAEALAARGIAVLRYDDRGFGESTGNPRGATSADFANDTRAVLAYLRTRPDVDTTKLFLLGHSEGGLIAPLIASTDARLRGIIVMAGPARTGQRILEYQNHRVIDAQPNISQAQRDSLYKSVPLSLDSLAAAMPWMRFFLSYDPLPAARATKVPVLILQGETDRQITADQAPELAAAFRAGGNRDVTLHVWSGVNHLFVADPSGDPATYGNLKDRNVVANVVELITDWVASHVR